MEEEFDYLVTPVAQNIIVYCESQDWKVVRVFGSPGNEDPTPGTLVKMGSTFPSPLEGVEMCKGAVVLVKLEKIREATSPLVLR